MTRGANTVRLKLWLPGEPIPLLAVMVIGKTVVLAGEPGSTGVPDSTPALERVTPLGSVPVSV